MNASICLSGRPSVHVRPRPPVRTQEWVVNWLRIMNSFNENKSFMWPNLLRGYFLAT